MIALYFFIAGLTTKQVYPYADRTSQSCMKFVPIVDHTAATIEPTGYKWVSIRYQGRKIISLNGRSLPLQVLLPPKITPLEPNALLYNSFGQSKLVFAIFYPYEDAAYMQEWIKRFPNDFPFAKGSYNSEKTQISRSRITWDARLSVYSDYNVVQIQLLPWDQLPIITGNDDLSKDAKRLTQVWAASKSPIRHRNRFIEMQFIFSAKIKK